jgi:hypothetical protein
MAVNDALTHAQWFKSSKSNPSGGCVEVAFLDDGQVGVRDSKNRPGPALIFTANEWDAFTAGVKHREFDRPI